MITDLEGMFKDGQPWPPESEQARLALYAENRKLRDGDHSAVFKDLGRFAKEERDVELEIILNYFWLITKKTADHLFGQPPVFSTNEGDSTYLQDLLTRMNFNTELRESCYDVSPFGTGLIKARLVDSKAVLEATNPDIWYPVVTPGSIRDIRYHVLAYQFEKEDIPGKPKHYLKVETHEKGAITHLVYNIDDDKKIKGEADLGSFPEFKGLKEVETTNIDDFLVMPIHNQRTSEKVYGISDYGSDLKSIIRGLERAYSLKQDILELFARPSIIGPRQLMDYDPVTKKKRFLPGRYYGVSFDSGETPFIPQALTWEAHLGEVKEHITQLKEEFFALAEVPPTMLAQQLAGTAESGTALRIKMDPMLSKVDRFKEQYSPVMIKAISLAAQLEKHKLEVINIKFQGSLPRIPLEDAQRVAMLKRETVLSREQGLIELDYDKDQAAEIAAQAANEAL